MDLDAAVAEAAEANLGITIEEVKTDEKTNMTGTSDACALLRHMSDKPDVLPTLVFRSTDGGDMQANSRSRKESTAELIR